MEEEVAEVVRGLKTRMCWRWEKNIFEYKLYMLGAEGARFSVEKREEKWR